METTIATSLAAIIGIGKAVGGEIGTNIRGKADELKKEYKIDFSKAGKYAPGLKDGSLVRTDGSITKLVKLTVVTPSIIVTKNAYKSPIFDQAATMALDTFTSFFIQAYDIITQLYMKSGIEAIDLLSTDQYKMADFASTVAGRLVSEMGINAESYMCDGLKCIDYSINTEHLTINNLDLDAPHMVFSLNNEAKKRAPIGEHERVFEYEPLVNVKINKTVEGHINTLKDIKFESTKTRDSAPGTIYEAWNRQLEAGLLYTETLEGTLKSLDKSIQQTDEYKNAIEKLKENRKLIDELAARRDEHTPWDKDKTTNKYSASVDPNTGKISVDGIYGSFGTDEDIAVFDEKFGEVYRNLVRSKEVLKTHVLEPARTDAKLRRSSAIDENVAPHLTDAEILRNAALGEAIEGMVDHIDNNDTMENMIGRGFLNNAANGLSLKQIGQIVDYDGSGQYNTINSEVKCPKHNIDVAAEINRTRANAARKERKDDAAQQQAYQLERMTNQQEFEKKRLKVQQDFQKHLEKMKHAHSMELKKLDFELKEAAKWSDEKREARKERVTGNKAVNEALDERQALYNFLNREIKIKIPVEEIRQVIEIPIRIRANIMVIDPDELRNVIDSKNYKKTLWYRLNEWRAGAISFRDLIFCGDLIQEYKKARLSPNSKLLGKISELAVTNDARKVLTNFKGFESSYNMIMMATEDKVIFDQILRGDIQSSDLVRNKFLRAMQGYSLSILDDDNERLTMGLTDINGIIDVGYKKALKRGQSSGPEMMDIFKALSNNTIPRF